MIPNDRSGAFGEATVVDGRARWVLGRRLAWWVELLEMLPWFLLIVVGGVIGLVRSILEELGLDGRVAFWTALWVEVAVLIQVSAVLAVVVRHTLVDRLEQPSGHPVPALRLGGLAWVGAVPALLLGFELLFWPDPSPWIHLAHGASLLVVVPALLWELAVRRPRRPKPPAPRPVFRGRRTTAPRRPARVRQRRREARRRRAGR